ncbi:hypothetical protein JOC75_004427 [Metabacillus crassostreae]|uniref:hypothetical protein n=1 Tax=Metabacillus crassostreae TaxID=929098 RepID=UPI0019563513|nr:hypothetical protein [Metabacillus crassostreae]MBM7606379.1 hypothetical protein [Metabacillus crassostreae]
MIGRELEDHLETLEVTLTELNKSYNDFRVQNIRKSQRNPSLILHLLYVTILTIIIVGLTYALGSLFLDEKVYLFYIASIQVLLSILLYIILVNKMAKGFIDKEHDSKVPRVKLSNYELDQLRFQSLQDLARSPIPSNFIAPSIVKEMKKLVSNGTCHSIEDCIKYIEKKPTSNKQTEELELIKYLQTISYH